MGRSKKQRMPPTLAVFQQKTSAGRNNEAVFCNNSFPQTEVKEKVIYPTIDEFYLGFLAE